MGCDWSMYQDLNTLVVFWMNRVQMVLQYAMALHEALLVPVLLYGSATMIWREKKRSRIRAVQMHSQCGSK